VHLTLAGTGLNGTDLSALQRDVEEKLSGLVGSLAPGGAVRQARVSALLLQDARVVDAKVEFQFEDESGGAPEFTLAKGATADLVRPVQFDPIDTEQAPTSTVIVKVSAFLPIHLTPGTTQAQAAAAIENAFVSHLATRAADAPLTFDSVAAAIRDDSRFALVRADGHVTVEAGDRFMQLADGAGEYRPAPGELLQSSDVAIDVREGGI
jgi:hypothetical protein